MGRLGPWYAVVLGYIVPFLIPEIRRARSVVALQSDDKMETIIGEQNVEQVLLVDDLTLKFFGIPEVLVRDPIDVDIHLHVDRFSEEYYEAYWLCYSFVRRVLLDPNLNARWFITSYLGDNTMIGLVKTFDESNDGHVVLRRLSELRSRFDELRFNETFKMVDRQTFEPVWSDGTSGDASLSLIFMGPELDPRFPGVTVLILKDSKSITSEEIYRERLANRQYNLLGEPNQALIFNCLSRGCDKDPNSCQYDLTFVMDRTTRYYYDVFWLAYATIRDIQDKSLKTGNLTLDATIALISMSEDGPRLLRRYNDAPTEEVDLQALSDFKFDRPAKEGSGIGDPQSANLVTIFLFGLPSEREDRIEVTDLFVSVVVNPRLDYNKLTVPQIKRNSRVSAGVIEKPTPDKIREALADKCLF